MIGNTNILEGIWLLGCNGLTDYLLEKICRTYFALKCINVSSCCHINDISFKSIYTHCRQLKCLEAKMLVNLTDNCVVGVENQNELEVLDLGYSLLTDVGYDALINGTCRNLTRLDLGFCRNLSDVGISSISQKCKNLRLLILNRCKKISDDGIVCVSKNCELLMRLQINDLVLLSDQGLYSIAKYLTQLESLSMKNCNRISDEGLKNVVEKCKKLKRLSIDECSNLTDMSTTKIGLDCTGLEVLTIAAIPKLTFVTMEALATATSRSLVKLDLSGSSWTSGFNYYLTDDLLRKAVKRLGCLEEFNANHCYFLTDSGIAALAEHCKRLKVLNLNCNNWMTDMAILSITSNCKFLKELGVSQCTKLTDSSLQMIMNGCSALTILDVGGCKHLFASINVISKFLENCVCMKALNICQTAKLQPVQQVGEICCNMMLIKNLKEKHRLDDLEYRKLWYQLIRG